VAKPINPATGESPSGPPGPPPATCISCGELEYPSSARRLPREATVELMFDVNPNGDVFNIKILTPSKHHEFNRAAIKALEKRKYASSESGIQGERAFIIFRLDE
jgi:TonB family protein